MQENGTVIRFLLILKPLRNDTASVPHAPGA